MSKFHAIYGNGGGTGPVIVDTFPTITQDVTSEIITSTEQSTITVPTTAAQGDIIVINLSKTTSLNCGVTANSNYEIIGEVTSNANNKPGKTNFSMKTLLLKALVANPAITIFGAKSQISVSPVIAHFSLNGVTGLRTLTDNIAKDSYVVMPYAPDSNNSRTYGNFMTNTVANCSSGQLVNMNAVYSTFGIGMVISQVKAACTINDIALLYNDSTLSEAESRSPVLLIERNA